MHVMPKKYPTDQRDRALRMALERLDDYPSPWAAAQALGPKLGVGPETLRKPRLRRRLTAFQAAVVAGLGALLGTASGFVPTVAYIYADTELRFVPPWTNLVLIAVVVPAVAAVAAGLLTRSRLPLSRRLAV
jgi:hypothetical protein